MEYQDTEEQIFCRVCGAKKRELNGHIRMHNLSSNEYTSKYPDAPMISIASARKKSKSVSEQRKKNPRIISKETRKRIGAASSRVHAQKKIELGETYLENLRFLAKNARESKGKNYKHSEETLKKMRGPRDYMKGNHLSEDHKMKLSKARTGSKIGPHSPETIIKMQNTWAERKKDTQTYNAYRQKISEQSKRPERIAMIRNSVAKSIRLGI